MFSQPIGVASCYFEWLDYYVILMTSIAKLLNIAPIFSFCVPSLHIVILAYCLQQVVPDIEMSYFPVFLDHFGL